MFAAVAFGAVAGLVALPAVPASAAAATCAWQPTPYQLPAGSDAADLDGYDGGRYAVGRTGTKPFFHDQDLVDPRATLWDNGTVAWRAAGELPQVYDVNSSGLMVGDTSDSPGDFYAITLTADGTTKKLPGDPSWLDYYAQLVNDRGDIVGTATTAGLEYVVVVWPANAPGTYRALPGPASGAITLTDLDDQGEIIGGTLDATQGAIWTTGGTYRHFDSPAFANPEAVVDGHVVGGWSTFETFGAAEWNAQGQMTRTIPGTSAVSFTALGGNGTIGGEHFVGSQQHAALWRDGQVVDPLDAVDTHFTLRWLSDDEHRLVGANGWQPTQYRCT